MPKKTPGRRKPLDQIEQKNGPKSGADKGKQIKRKQPRQLATSQAGIASRAAQNRKMAFELRSQRMSYRQIAAELGVSVQVAFRYVDEVFAELRESTLEKAEFVRQMELDTLDAMQARWEPLALHEGLDVQKIVNGPGGNPVVIRMEDYDAGLKAVDKVLKIQERRAKLLGLDCKEAPSVNVNVGVNVTLTEERREELMARRRAALEAQRK